MSISRSCFDLFDAFQLSEKMQQEKKNLKKKKRNKQTDKTSAKCKKSKLYSEQSGWRKKLNKKPRNTLTPAHPADEEKFAFRKKNTTETV